MRIIKNIVQYGLAIVMGIALIPFWVAFRRW